MPLRPSSARISLAVRRCYPFAFALLMSCGEMFGSDAHDEEPGGAGTQAEPVAVSKAALGGDCTSSPYIEIDTCQELQNMELDLCGDYHLTADLDCSSFDAGDSGGFRPVGTCDGWQPFSGAFHGDGHVITGLTIDRPEDLYVGLFGCIADSEVHEVGLENADINGFIVVGGIAGLAYSTTFDQVYVTGDVTAGNWMGGGIVGGLEDDNVITDSYSRANVSASGACGLAFGKSFVSTITNVYAAGTTECDPALLIGDPYEDAIVTDSYFDCTVAGGCSEDFSETTTTLQTEAHYTTAGWDFEEVWGFSGTGTYPCLLWEDGCGCAETDETCDGVDDDCSGQIDEDFASEQTTCGTGACTAQGVTSCVNGAEQDSCVAGTPASADSSCNGIDNDCNGAVDEDYASTSSSCGTGACARTGSTSCSGGTVHDSCQPGTPAASDATCNGADDNCNGSNDESYAGVPTSCGVGACAAIGLSSCLAGSVQSNCIPGTPSPDTNCNGFDEDCDGLADGDFPHQPTNCTVAGCYASGQLRCTPTGPEDTCLTNPVCVAEVACNDSDDNDGDDDIDCADADCSANASCAGLPEVCGNSADDDGDGAFDCADADCLLHAICNNVPPDPADVAPPRTTAGYTTLVDDTAFLYTGADPIQQGVAPGTLTAKLLATVRGRALDRNNTPLPGVLITVLENPEFGQTRTRDDGVFDLAMNGGSPRTIVFSLPGYLPAQRTVSLDWGDQQVVDDVVLIPFDTASTAVDLLSTDDMQVAVSSTSTDADGSRRAVLMFNETVEAQARMPDQSVVPLTQITVRATEYTVGANGLGAMPAQMPPTTAYTYAVELSVDEAVTMGATRVEFSETVPLYIDNFLEFPVGSAVPTGYYDRDCGRWIPSENGRVVQIVAISNGVAALDLTGDGTADDPSELQISIAELTRLASLYTVGTRLWRVPVDHFTPYDCNWPWGPPEGASFPPTIGDGSDDDAAPVDDPSQRCGSIINIENGELIEQIPIAGTPYKLTYTSSRAAKDRESHHRFTVVARDPDVPLAPMPDIGVQIVVGGRALNAIVEPTEWVAQIDWDGRDAMGRAVYGTKPIGIRTCYRYDAIYYPVRSDFARSFAQIRGPAAQAEFFTNELTEGSDRKIYICSTQRSVVTVREPPLPSATATPFATSGEDGWTLDVHHAYDVAGQVLELGDGSKRTIAGTPISSQVKDLYSFNIAGIDPMLGASRWGFVALDDGSLLTLSPQNDVIGSAVNRLLPSGQTVIADDSDYWHQPNYRIDVHAIGRATRCVACGEEIYIYEKRVEMAEEPAIIERITAFKMNESKMLVHPGRIVAEGAPVFPPPVPTEHVVNSDRRLRPVVGRDGSLYSFQRGVLTRLSPDGRYTTELDLGGRLPNGSNGNPISVNAGTTQFTYPVGDVVDSASRITIGPDDTIYLAVAWESAECGVTCGRDDTTVFDGLYALGPDGLLTTVMTKSAFQAEGFVHAGEIAVDSTNTVFMIAALPGSPGSTNNQLIKVVNGSPVTVVGQKRDSNALSGPATFYVDVTYMTFGPDGRLYLSEAAVNKLRRVDPLYSDGQLGEAQILIPSSSGDQIFKFDSRGRHLETRDGTTNALIRAFDYDARNLLSAIRDSANLSTVITRNTDGTIAKIVAPYGLETLVERASNGLIGEIVAPDESTYSFTYYDQHPFTDSGLMRTMVNPKSDTYSFQYDAYGKLIRDTDPAGGFSDLSSVEPTPVPGQTTTVTTAQGKTTRYNVQREGATVVRRSTQPDGTLHVNTSNASGESTTTQADGTTIAVQLAGDPRWGMAAPIVARREVRLPTGNLSHITTMQRAVTLSDPANPLSLQTLTDTTTINGRAFTRVYNAVASTETITSPVSRRVVTTFNTRGQPTLVTRTGLANESYTYDSLGRLSTHTIGTGSNARTSVFQYYAATGNPNYDGRVHTIELPISGQIKVYVPDAWGRTTSLTLPNGSSIQQSFDQSGNLASVTPPGRSQHTFSVTPQGDSDSYSSPPVGTGQPAVLDMSYSLDRDIELISYPDGRQADFIRDPTTGRIVQLVQSESSTSFVYNAVTGAVSSATRSDVLGSHTLTFGANGGLRTSEEWSGSSGMTAGRVEFSYNNNLWLTGRTIRGSTGASIAANFAYDNDGLVTAADGMTIGRSAQTGLPTSTTMQNVASTQTWSTFGEHNLQTVTYSGSTRFSESIAARDRLGRILTLTGQAPNASGTLVATNRTYAYDAAGHLSTVSTGGTELARYGYDANGNRVSHLTPAGEIVGLYDSRDRLTQYCPADAGGHPTPTSGLPCFQYEYLTGGQLSSKVDLVSAATTQYDYDEAGVLQRVTLPDSRVVAYEIDPNNRRVGKYVDGVKQAGWLYSGKLRIVAEVDAAGAIRSTFAYGSRRNTPEVMRRGGSVYRIITDRLGSVRLVINVGTGAIEQRLEYDEFGNVLVDSNPGFQPFGFAGGLFDSDTGLVRFGSRDYDAVTGRWTATDAIMFAGLDANLYAYVYGDPVNRIDPSGHLGPLATAGVGAAVGALFGAFSAWHQGQDPAAGAFAGAVAGAVAGLGGPAAAALVGETSAVLASYMAGSIAAVGNMIGQHLQYRLDPSTSGSGNKCGGDFEVNMSSVVTALVTGGLGYGVGASVGAYTDEMSTAAQMLGEGAWAWVTSSVEMAVNAMLSVSVTGVASFSS